MNLRIAIFTFNTEAQVFCCSCDKKESCGLGRKLLSYVSTDCVRSDFVEKFIEHIQRSNDGRLPDVFIINLQESSIKNPKKGFKSDQLLFAFRDCINKVSPNYSLVSEKLEGIGAEGIRGLRTGLIIDKNFDTKFNFLLYRPLFESKLKISEGQHFGKGAIMLELQIESNGKKYHIHFINTHLPFLEKEKDQGKAIRDETIRETFASFQRKLKNDNSRHIDKFVMGDLNYRIDFGTDNSAKNRFIDLIHKKELVTANMDTFKIFDQLRSTLPAELHGFNEGIGNDGPNFLPTCKLEKKCPITEQRTYQISKGRTARIPSWCDRILYLGRITCLLYESFDAGTTCKSDHIPVIGLYDVQPFNQTSIQTLENPIQIGGEDPYYKKYLKYKQKYTNFQNMIE